MNFDILLFFPEAWFIFSAVILMIGSLDITKEPFCASCLAPFLALVGFCTTLFSLNAEGMMFWDVYKVDTISQFMKAVIALGFLVVTLNASRQKTLDENKRADYYMLLTYSTLGLIFLCSSVELFTAYLALELSSYSLYAVIPLRNKSKGAAESGIKYILFGAAATALALYGLSYVMAEQNTTYIFELATKAWSFGDAPMAVIGLCLFLAGVFYKLALFPFHFWCPDVYQGASNETATFVATLPKMGAIVLLVRLGAFLQPGLEITTILAILGGISMTYGNLSALAQTDLKRILGFSAVAHAGYIMVGLVSGSAEGLGAATFYGMAYLLMNLLCFWVISRISVDGRNLKLQDLAGLHKRAPELAFALAAGAFALVGLPPTVGFMGKLFLLTSAWGHGYNWLVILLALNSAFAIFYYLNMVRYAYTVEMTEETPAPDNGVLAVAGATVLTGAVLALGMVPANIFSIALEAGRGVLQ